MVYIFYYKLIPVYFIPVIPKVNEITKQVITWTA